MPSVNEDNFASFFPNLNVPNFKRHFYCTVETSVRLNNIGKSRHPYLVCDLRRKAFSILALSVMLAVGFNVLYQVEEVLFIVSEFLLWTYCWLFQNAFLCLLRWSCRFCLYSIDLIHQNSLFSFFPPFTMCHQECLGLPQVQSQKLLVSLPLFVLEATNFYPEIKASNCRMFLPASCWGKSSFSSLFLNFQLSQAPCWNILQRIRHLRSKWGGNWYKNLEPLLGKTYIQPTSADTLGKSPAGKRKPPPEAAYLENSCRNCEVWATEIRLHR